MTEIHSPDDITGLRNQLRDRRVPYIRLSLADELLAALDSHERLREMLEEAITRIAKQSDLLSKRAEKAV